MRRLKTKGRKQNAQKKRRTLKLRARKETQKYTNVNCCMCDRKVKKEGTLIPRKCLSKHGEKAAHRICQACWFNPVSGFALESGKHECPGCRKKLSLTKYPYVKPVMIDLVSE